MLYKGIEKGDQKFKHFTFEENDFIIKNGVPMYKVNYGKDKLEGDTAEDVYGFVKCENVMFIGPRPKSIPTGAGTIQTPQPKPQVQKQPQTVTEQQPVAKKSTAKKETTKTTRKKKEDIVVVSTGADVSRFEYITQTFTLSDSNDFQDSLNKLGDDGWEMCGFDTSKGLIGPIQIFTVFKRKKA